MIERSLGANGPRVGAIGLGCMGMSDLYGPADESESVATIRAALDAGVTLLDTGDYYGMGTRRHLPARGDPHQMEILDSERGRSGAP